MEKLISIVLVNYNGLCDTRACVESISRCNYSNYRIVIVDNGSDDKNNLMVDQYLNEHADIVYAPENIGFSGGNNIGINFAHNKYDPDYYLLLNNDTEVTSETFNVLVGLSENKVKCGIATGKILYHGKPDTIWYGGGKFDKKTGIADHPALGKMDSTQYSGIRKTNFITGCLMLIPKRVIEHVGLLDESYFLYAEDTDYCCRVMNEGFELWYDGKAVIYHKVSASTRKSSSMQQYYNFRNNWYIIKYYSTKPLYGYLKRTYRYIKTWRREKYDFSIFIKALFDFLKEKKGKSEFIQGGHING